MKALPDVGRAFLFLGDSPGTWRTFSITTGSGEEIDEGIIGSARILVRSLRPPFPQSTKKSRITPRFFMRKKGLEPSRRCQH